VTQVTLICDFCHGSAISKWSINRDGLGAALVKGGSSKDVRSLARGIRWVAPWARGPCNLAEGPGFREMPCAM
jgi:hypothetical protein